MKGIRKLAPYLRPYYKTIAVMVILGVFSSLADSIYPLFTSYALDTFVAGKTLRGIVPFSLLYLLLMAVTEAVNYYCLYKCGVVEMKVDRDLRNASFNHLQTLSFSYFNQNNVGYIHARVMSDTGKIGELVAWRLMDFVWEASYILFVIVMMLAINVRLAAWTLLIFPAGVLIITYFQRRLVEGNRKIREINSTITGNFNEGITGARSIRTLVIEKLMQRDFEKDTTRMRKASIKTTHYSALFASVVTMLSSFALALVLWRGGKLTMQGVIRLGTLSVFMSYAVGMLEPVQNVIQTLAAFILYKAS